MSSYKEFYKKIHTDQTFFFAHMTQTIMMPFLISDGTGNKPRINSLFPSHTEYLSTN